MAQGFIQDQGNVYNPTLFVSQTKDADFTAANGFSYNIEHATPATRVDATLPAAPSVGDTIRFHGRDGSGGFGIIPGASGHKIRLLSSECSATTGYWRTTGTGQALELVYAETNLWVATYIQGQFDSDLGVRQGPADSTKPLRVGTASNQGDAVNLAVTLFDPDQTTRGRTLAVGTTNTKVWGIKALTVDVIVVLYSDATNLLLIKSSDGGSTWGSPVTIVAHGGATGIAASMTVADANTIYVGMVQGSTGSARIWKSTNAGASFGSPTTIEATTGGSGIQGISLTNFGTTHIWAIVAYTPGTTDVVKVYRSTDSGASWSAGVTLAGPDNGNYFSVSILAVSTSVIHVVYQNPAGGASHRSSADSGATFTAAHSITTTKTPASDIYRDASGNLYVATLLVGTSSVFELWKSTDDGVTWAVIASTAFTGIAGQSPCGAGLVTYGNTVILGLYEKADNGHPELKGYAVSYDAGASWKTREGTAPTFGGQICTDGTSIFSTFGITETVYAEEFILIVGHLP